MLGDLLANVPQHLSIRLLVQFIVPLVVLIAVRSLSSRLLLRYRLRNLPLINDLGIFKTNQKAKQNFFVDAAGLLKEGVAKSPSAFRIDTDNAEILVLSPDTANEIRNDERLSFTHLLADDFLGNIPAFVNFNPHTGMNDMAGDIIRQKINAALGQITKHLSDEADLVFSEQWTDNTEWHPLDLTNTALQIVARVSSRVFLGPELCRNPDWLRITINYTVNLFYGVMALKKWPRYLHPIVWRFVPEVRKVQDQIQEAVRLIKPVVEKRTAEGKSAKSRTEYVDAIQWANETASSTGRHYDPALLQLGFSLAAIHTTSDLLTQVLHNLGTYPEYIEPLREELVSVLKEEGMTKAGLYKLQLLDSFIKESQRIKPGAQLVMRRMVMEDVTLSSGLVLPRGMQIGFPLHKHFDQEVYSDPETFDGYRFVKMAGDPKREKSRHLVSTSVEHMGFGYGKHACPGRFFAASEIKVILCHILLKYEFKLVEGSKPTIMRMGWILAPDPTAQFLIKRREGVDESLLRG
ncbi:cytochrome P450 monooxygenase NtnM [Paramyrothecium foliicola]|nr:cytochrome P450 monooxygenase NtnM [Paramyrothecium foliicola]